MATERYKPILDDEGFIDASFLEKELQESLAFDVQYKQKDNMKKRACKVAGSYDEFKEMVAASHLKTVTSKEVESLSHAKKGWQKAAAKQDANAPLILNQEKDKMNKEKSLQKGVVLAVASSLPRTAAEFERDFKRQKNENDKLRYLIFVGLKRSKKVLTEGADTDLIESILQLLVSCKSSIPDPDPVAVAQEATSTQNEDEAAPGTSSAKATAETPFNTEHLYKWLKAIPSFSTFALAKTFASAELLHGIRDALALRCQPYKWESVAASYDCASASTSNSSSNSHTAYKNEDEEDSS